MIEHQSWFLGYRKIHEVFLVYKNLGGRGIMNENCKFDISMLKSPRYAWHFTRVL